MASFVVKTARWMTLTGSFYLQNVYVVGFSLTGCKIEPRASWISY